MLSKLYFKAHPLNVFMCPFLDGNKRTSIYLGMHFLQLNNYSIAGFAETMENVVVGVVQGSTSKEHLEQIIGNFISKDKKIDIQK